MRKTDNTKQKHNTINFFILFKFMKARFLALAALVLGMVSCQQDVELATPQGGEVDFQLKVDAVELSTRAGKDGAADTQAAHDSAFGAIDYLQATDVADPYRVDWTEVDLRYSLEVYDKAADYANAVPVKDRQVVIVDKYDLLYSTFVWFLTASTTS